MGRRVMRAEVTRDDIDDATAACGFQLTNVVPPSATHPGQLIFGSHAGTLLHMVEDTRLGVTYWVSTGEGEQAADEAMAQALPCYDEATIAAGLAQHDDVVAFQRALVALAFQSSGPTPEVVGPIEDALGAAEEPIVNAALMVVSYVPWPALQNAVTRVAMRGSGIAAQNAERILGALYQGAGT